MFGCGSAILDLRRLPGPPLDRQRRRTEGPDMAAHTSGRRETQAQPSMVFDAKPIPTPSRPWDEEHTYVTVCDVLRG
ncbi:hypothetical protein GCM10027615_63740 [Plantactinospora veratri]